MNTLLRSVLPTDKLPHIWQVLATLLAVGAVFTLCWYLTQQGLLDLAATGMAFFVVTLMRLIGPTLSRKAPTELKRTARLIDTAREEFADWMANRKLLSLALVAFAYTLAFLVLRYVASTVMLIIASPWLALAAGLALASVVASPVLVQGLVESFRSKAGPVVDGAYEQNDP